MLCTSTVCCYSQPYSLGDNSDMTYSFQSTVATCNSDLVCLSHDCEKIRAQKNQRSGLSHMVNALNL